MKRKESAAEFANKKLDQLFDGDDDNNNTALDIDSYLNNNSTALVLKNLENKDDANKQ